MGDTQSVTIVRGHIIYIYISGKYGPPMGCHPFEPCLPLHIIWVPSVISMILVSKTFSLRPDEAILDLTWQKLVYTNKINSVTKMQ